MLHKVLGQDILNGLFQENVVIDKYNNAKKDANGDKVQISPDTISFRRPKTLIKEQPLKSNSLPLNSLSHTFFETSKIILSYQIVKDARWITYTFNIFPNKKELNEYTGKEVNFVAGNYKILSDESAPEVDYQYQNDNNNEFYIKGVFDKSSKTLKTLNIYRKTTEDWENFKVEVQKTDNIYLGLFTQMPTNPYTGEGFVEPSVNKYLFNADSGEWPENSEEKILCKEYIRININRSSAFQKSKRILHSSLNEGIPEISNQEIIVFPEARGMDRYFINDQEIDPTQSEFEVEEKGWGKIVGFGLFYYDIGEEPEDSDIIGNVPFLWGTISDGTTANNEFVNVDANTVPIIRVNGLRITME